MRRDWKEKKIGVLGLGIEGIASSAYLRKHGAEVTVLDQKERTEFDAPTLNALEKEGVQFSFGKDYKDHLSQFDLVVRSPGVKLSREEREILAGKLTSQTQLFLEACPGRVIGVTGTKGKGTTSALIYEMLKASGLDLPAGRQGVYLGGNIGTPPFTFLDSLKESSLVVLELSSFQLEDVTKSPDIAVLLMVTPDHLEYHGDMAAYVEAKRNILRYQTPEDFAVINRDYVPSNESDIYTDGKVFYVSRERPSTEQGCFIKDDAVWVRFQGAEWKIIDTKEIALPGKHNLENVCAAVMAATLAGATRAEITQVLKTFKGLEHRLELVREVNDVKYYDDSIATNPESAVAGIQAFENPEILILGGVTEGSDFDALGAVIAKDRTIKAIIGIGKEWPTIKAAIEKHKPFEHLLFIEGADSMEKVVQAASKLARPGDVVLLSPACKSFDMFKSYKERGEQFKKAVNKL
jgi:UDP-N-acetylmuramoylalanine--D-glutamate ligase